MHLLHALQFIQTLRGVGNGFNNDHTFHIIKSVCVALHDVTGLSSFPCVLFFSFFHLLCFVLLLSRTNRKGQVRQSSTISIALIMCQPTKMLNGLKHKMVVHC